MNVAAIILMALVLMLAACSQGGVAVTPSLVQSASPVASPASPTPASVAPSQTISTSPTPSTLTSLSWAEAEFGGSVDGVVAFGPEYVAVGTLDRVPTAWTSPDGQVWERHAVAYDPPAEDEPGMPGPWMGNLVEHDGWLYAIGGYQGGGDGIRPLGWRSQDGRTWEQIVSRNPFYTDGYLVWGLISGAPGLLALTHGFADMSGGVWLWTAEGSWAEVTDALPGTSAGANFYDAAWADGRFVVVGHGSDGGATGAATWTSTDGRHWEVNGAPYPWESNQDPLGVVTAVAPAVGTGWSAFLMAPGRAVGLHSTDARTWEVSQDLIGRLAGHIWLVANVGGRLIAAGGAEGEGSWLIASSDGRTWDDSHRTDGARAPAFHPRGAPSIASSGSSIVVFLELPDELDRGSVVLHAPLD